MKIKLLIVLVLLCNYAFPQKNVRDSLKSFTMNIVQKAIERGKIKRLAVWDFTDIHKQVTTFGSYISEQVSVYAENINSIQLMDRQNLKSLLREHKLKSEGFIDKNTIMQLGKFKEVDAVVVGSVIMVDKEFQVVVKIIETSFGETLAADEQFFEMDKRMTVISSSTENSKGNTDINETTKSKPNDILINEPEKNNKTKTEICSECNGSGTIKLQTSCNECRGTGRVTCSQCSGTGKWGDIYPTKGIYETPTCSKCRGSGKTKCSNCSGTEQITSVQTCSKCHGTGRTSL